MKRARFLTARRYFLVNARKHCELNRKMCALSFITRTTCHIIHTCMHTVSIIHEHIYYSTSKKLTVYIFPRAFCYLFINCNDCVFLTLFVLVVFINLWGDKLTTLAVKISWNILIVMIINESKKICYCHDNLLLYI